MKRVIQRSVRLTHVAFLKRALPRRVAMYLHALELKHWEAFEELVSFFRKRGYRFTDPAGLFESSNEPSIMLSLDDNYRSWFEALALFDRLDVRVTFYVNTRPLRDLASGAEIQAYYDRLRHGGDRTPLDTLELLALARDGHTIGSHTHSHIALTSLPHESAQREIRLANEILEGILGCRIKDFSFPFGMRRHFNPALRAYCLQSGLATIANGTPGMLHGRPAAADINRSPWDLERPLHHNVLNLQIDGRAFERVTGRGAAG